MKFRNSTLIAAAALLAAPAAFAQTTQTSPAPAQSPGTTAPATAPGTSGAGTAAGATASATVTDSEIGQFATAALAVAKIRQDATVADADKNTKSVEAITATGLTATRFNEIAQAMQGDPALNKKIQDAAAKQQPAAAAPAQR